MVRDGKPKGFFYLDHRTVDAAHAIITDTHTTAVVHDSTVYLGRLDRQIERFDFMSGRSTRRRLCHAGHRQGLEERQIGASPAIAIPPRPSKA